MDNEAGNEYAWLGAYEKTWEAVQEDEHGSLERSMASIMQRAKRRQMQNRNRSVQIGMVRHMIVIIDGSTAMFDQDLRPNRFIASIQLLESFVSEFFDHNPVSQLGLMTLKNRRCELLTDLSGNIKNHQRALEKLKKTFCEGEASLFNGIDQARKVLKNLPNHVSREILIIMGSLSSMDPSDINPIIEDLTKSGVKCSIIGLAAAVHVCQMICQETKGKYGISLDEAHFKTLLNEHLMPPISPEGQECSQIKMGFPQLNVQPEVISSLCMCHFDTPDMKDCYGKAGYLCPQCGCKYCELPVECLGCGLMLVSSVHLARSYHHLFPLEAYEEVSVVGVDKKNRYCYGCQKMTKEGSVYKCRGCSQCFCTDCDVFVHNCLHNCPGCASRRHAGP